MTASSNRGRDQVALNSFMAVAPLTGDEHILARAFNYLPHPVIILSSAYAIVVANRACDNLFADHDDLVGQDIRTLPLIWRDGDKKTFHHLLAHNTRSIATTPTFEQSRQKSELTSSNVFSDVHKLQVVVHNSAPNATITACLLVTDLPGPDGSLRMLSFEGINTSHLDLQGVFGKDAKVPPVVIETIHLPSDDTLTGTRSSTEASQDQLTSRYAQFRDAYYFANPEVPGFILAADETFCLPSYRTGENAAPVEIDDIELFFSNWNMWDPEFTVKTPLSEYPAIWLNRNRKNFTNRRFGLIEEGRRVIIETSGDPLYDQETGDYIGGVIWVRTLGEYEDVVAADLAASYLDIRAVCERLPHLIWTTDPTGKADWFSHSWYQFTGLSEQESLGRAFEHVIVEEDMQAISKAFAAATASQTEFHVEARYRRADGEWIWMGVRAKPLMDLSGTIVKWYGSSTDIDHLVKERNEAARLNVRMMEMLSLANVGLFEIHADWRLSMIDGRMQWLNSQDKVPHILNELDRLFDEGAQLFRRHLVKVMDAECDSAVFEAKIGTRWYKFRFVGDTDQRDHSFGLKKVLGCSVDITEQREHATLATENARLATEASLQLEKNRLKTAFLAHMSHEIRTPIAGIVGTADMLLETCVNEEQIDGIRDIQISADHLLTIVNDILDLSKVEAGKLILENSCFDLHQVIAQTLKHFGSVVRAKGLELKFCQDLTQPLHIVGDAGRVKQILMNLISNAVKFTSQGFIQVDLTSHEGELSISVEDTGSGIDDTTMATLFRPFVQGDTSTARLHGGTGLGLTISRKFAEMMRGTLVLESVSGVGTKAILVIPETQPSGGTPSPPPDPETASHALSYRSGVRRLPLQVCDSDGIVLIAEDNAINQKVALNLVRKLGYQAHAVWNGQEVLDFIEQKGTPLLVLMDCQMPNLDGYAAVRELRLNQKYQQARSIPVIALTASAIHGDREKCRAAGMDDYLAKPVTKTLLLKTLEKWIPKTEVNGG